MKYFLPILLGFSLVGANAQTSYDVTNRVVLENEDCQLTKTSLILPVPQSNNYQTITNLEYSSGQVLDAVNSENKYLRDVKVSDFTYEATGAWASGKSDYTEETAPFDVDNSSYYDTESFAPIGSDDETFPVEITYVGPGSDNAQTVTVTAAAVGITQPASDGQ